MDEHAYAEGRLQRARLGLDLEEARREPLYAFLMDRAAEEADAAMKQLVDADPTDTGTIVRLQGEVKRLHDMERWVREAIDDGRAATTELEDFEVVDD